MVCFAFKSELRPFNTRDEFAWIERTIQMHELFFFGKKLQERCKSSHKGLAYVGESWRRYVWLARRTYTKPWNARKQLELSQVLLRYHCVLSVDINSGYKYPDPPGTLNYRETGGSNQVEVQIRVDKPSQHPQPSTTEATVRDKQSNLNSAKVIKTRSLHNKKKPRAGGWEIKLKMQQKKTAASTGSQLLRVRRRHKKS